MGWHDNAAKQRTEKYIETTGYRNDQIDRQIDSYSIDPTREISFLKNTSDIGFYI